MRVVEGWVSRVEIWRAVGRGWLQDSNWLDRSDVILKRKSSSLECPSNMPHRQYSVSQVLCYIYQTHCERPCTRSKSGKAVYLLDVSTSLDFPPITTVLILKHSTPSHLCPMPLILQNQVQRLKNQLEKASLDKMGGNEADKELIKK